jgi:hypothetical protein
MFSAVEFGRRSDIPDGAMKPDGVVMIDILCHEPPGIVKREGSFRSDAFSFERFVKPFKLSPLM